MRKFLRGFLHAGRGIALLIGGERNARFHLVATLVVVFAAAISRRSPTQWGLIVLAIALVWAAEAMNTALERLANRVTRDQDPEVRDVKDIAAGGVLLASIGALLLAVAAFFPG